MIIEIKHAGKERKYLFNRTVEKYVRALAERHKTNPAVIILLALANTEERLLAHQIELRAAERVAELLHARIQAGPHDGRPQTLPRQLHNDTQTTDPDYGGLSSPPATEL